MRLGIGISLSLLFIYSLCSCQKSAPNGPSVLLIAVEGLPSSALSCNTFEEVERSGFQTLCAEAVRFTHAFTTSPMAQPAMGSILTGELPITNGLRDNGMSYLQAQKVTLAEKLVLGKARTFFVASAPTIKRYSRLHQGFENFNDDYDLANYRLYRPISESLSLFKAWLSNEIINTNYFAVIHVSDLLFPEVITQTELLESRPRGGEGQLEEVDENLYLLFNYLKQRGLWNNSYVIFVGLHGTTDANRLNELHGTSLFSENVSIPLFIKPPKGREEIPHQWKVDMHVTLQDLGLTLEDIFQVHAGSSHPDSFIGASLLPLINGKTDARFNNRPIFVESAWGPWALNQVPRYSIRDNQWLVIFDESPLLYNTLTDRAENNRISLKDTLYQETVDRLAGLFPFPRGTGFSKPSLQTANEFHFARMLVENDGQPLVNYMAEIKDYLRNNPSSEVIRWLALDTFLRQKQWASIEELNKLSPDPFIEQYLKMRSGSSSTGSPSFCLALVGNVPNDAPSSERKKCDRKEFLTLLDWLEAGSKSRDLFLERFSMIYRTQLIQLKIIYFDLSTGGVVIGANTKKLRDILLLKLAISLPKLQKDMAVLEKRVGPL